MPRKQEIKATQVLEYFGSSPLDAAKLVLQLATQIVKKREPEKAKPREKPARPARGAAASVADTPTEAAPPVSTTNAAPPAGPQPRTRRTTQAPPAGSAPAPAAAPPAGQTDGLPGMAGV